MKATFLRYKKTTIAAVFGAVLGYTYYKLVGCSNGSCMITSNPWISTLYGMVMGMLAVGFPQKQKSTSIQHD